MSIPFYNLKKLNQIS